MIIKDHPETIGAFLISLILGSNKTTVSVATGHTSYWPLYLSIGNIHNNVCRAVLFCLDFWPYQKVSNSIFNPTAIDLPFNLADNESRNDFNYRRFRRQLLHTSLQKILELVRQYMTAPKIVHCPDGHYR